MVMVVLLSMTKINIKKITNYVVGSIASYVINCRLGCVCVILHLPHLVVLELEGAMVHFLDLVLELFKESDDAGTGVLRVNAESRVLLDQKLLPELGQILDHVLHIALIVVHPDVVLLQIVRVGEEQVELLRPRLGLLGVHAALERIKPVVNSVAEGRVEHENGVVGLVAEDVIPHGIELVGAVLRDEDETEARHLLVGELGVEGFIVIAVIGIRILIFVGVFATRASNSLDEHLAEEIVLLLEGRETLEVQIIGGLLLVVARLGLLLGRLRGGTVGPRGRCGSCVLGHG
mmetsp:Transcript_11356/g.26697  ORF Transcript_11356/g.26697 Transcript_11356/m.26697 type:complete len:290 (-) Transcript_11356:107-976(-)